MLSAKITKLFHILQCSNTDIARFAGCSPSNISRLKSGARELGAESRSVQRLAEGIYRYANDENMLSVLTELCGVDDSRETVMVRAILDWLYAENDFMEPHTVIPRSKKSRELRRRSFGERLGRAMKLLEFSNGQLAAALNVDVSLISRYRSGIYHPGRNEPIKERLSHTLFFHAEKSGRRTELAGLCGIAPEELTSETLTDWLYGTEEERASEMAEMLFRSIDMFTPEPGSALAVPSVPPAKVQDRYWGTKGLRDAVVRFLGDAVREGGELLLYSDEPMDWMSRDPAFFSLWGALMVACIRNGVHIRIIHNIDRIETEMVAAINGWFPLYVSDMIEPYIFRKVRNTRFCHTIFIRPGSAGILGSFPADIGEGRWYDYILDKDMLEAMEHGYEVMLSGASPLLKVYTADKADEFWKFCREYRTERWVTILYGLSIGTMPEGLMEKMLDRAGITGTDREAILTLYEKRRRQMLDTLEGGSVDEIIAIPDRKLVLDGKVEVNLGAEAIDLTLTYSPEEYAGHIAELRRLTAEEKNYRLTLLPQSPFHDLQVFTMKNIVVVLRCREPFAAFVFSNTALTRSVTNYFGSLIEKYGTDRAAVLRALEEYR